MIKTNIDITNKARCIPMIRHFGIRILLGFFVVIFASVFPGVIIKKGQFEINSLMMIISWIFSVLFTDKYVHKYPQRYYTYLLASHLKAAIVMAIFLWIMSKIAGPQNVPQDVLWTGYVVFVFTDFLVSVPCRWDIQQKTLKLVTVSADKDAATDNVVAEKDYYKLAESLIDKQALLKKIRAELDGHLFEFIEKTLPEFQGGTGDVLILDDIHAAEYHTGENPVGLLIGRTRINEVLRLNKYIEFCINHLSMGGYLIIRYMPLDNMAKNLKRRYKGLFYWLVFIPHFIWYRAIPKISWLEKLYFSPLLSWIDKIHLSIVKKRNRALAKAEVWGRLSFWGMRVLEESKGNGELFIIAQRLAMPVQNKVPSFYLVAALEKVGLDGEIIRTHKIRTMYPFSEFLQKRIFEDHGLAATGKFANDFRLTEFGRFLRKYWLDELPQIFDWLRGDLKLVGMRATSPHFLSLYPKKLYDLYVQIKPGLIPPIFDENTNGFNQIVEIELKYLQDYHERPFRTDFRNLMKTFTDIVFRGIRSK